ncbi:MAG: dicarboxylate/amino acid:cation symporter [Mogibacterium sp.]|nr:dicarboxylate/amino acid:cation symporter [Mogibacterium sp.]
MKEGKEKKPMSLATKIFIALVAGIVVGLVFQSQADFLTSYIQPFGTIFLNLLKFIVVPIVLFSIMAGVVSMSDIRKVGKVGGITVVYFFITTAIAIVIGLVLAHAFKGSFPALTTTGLEYEAKEPIPFMDTLVNIFPSNFLSPMVDATMLQVIVIALILGFAIILIGGEKSAKAISAIDVLNEVFMKAMEMIISLSPFGVFCLLAPVVAVNGPMVIGSLAKVILAAYIAYIIHAVCVYSLSVKFLSGMSPIKFFKGISASMAFAFSSASSVGTLPLTLENCDELGAEHEISSFVLPLGATINMDGTAIYQGVAAVFIASCYGIDLTGSQMMTIVLTAVLASIGTAGVPGSGMIMLAMVLQSVGLPVEGIALIAGVDRIFDMGRTCLNITGDASCAIIVSHLDRKWKGEEA